MHILIADDHTSTRMVIQNLLQQFGHTVSECSNGAEACAAFSSEAPPRMALLDWMMPGMDGLEVIRRIRAIKDWNAYLILLTSRGSSQDKVLGLDSGADDYIVKPIEPGELKARIQAGVRILEMQDRLNHQMQELAEAVRQIRTLHGILPICSFCKKIRDDQGYWEQVETYVRNHSQADFSHSVCPDCMQHHYPEIRIDSR
jgi:DNA-binding response OmpR family regulator